MKLNMMRMLGMLVALCMVIGMIPSMALNVHAAEPDYTWDSGTATLTVNTDAGITAWETDVAAADIKAVVVKDTVSTIEGKVFQGLYNLESLAFEGAVAIKSEIVDGASYSPFAETVKLEELSFASTVDLGGGVFWYDPASPNTALKDLSFPADSTLGSAVFSNCIALKKLDFKGESNIGSGAFSNAANLEEINFGEKTNLSSGVFVSSNSTLKTLNFPAGSTFGSVVFSNHTALEEITFEGDAVLTAGGCFGNLPALKTIDFKGESNLSSGAFGNTTNLAEINFGGKTSIGSGVFCYSESSPNTALKELSFPADSTFGSSVFSYCTALEEIVFNGDVTLTAGGCFYNVPALETVEFKGESKLSSGAIGGAVSLKTLKFGGKTDIGNGVLGGAGTLQASGMDDIVIPAGSTVGISAFEGANITSIEFKDTTPPTFGANAFADCPQDGIIYVPGEAYDAYVAALNEAAEGAFAANPVPLQIKKAEEKPNEPVCDHANKEWDKDAEGHWYVCPDCEELEKEVDEHEYVDGVCECGAEKPAETPEVKPVIPSDDDYEDDDYSIFVKVKFDGVDEDEIDEVNAILVRNGKAYKNKDITEMKDWKHEWTGLDDNKKWSVDVKEIAGYNVDVDNVRGNYWVITISKEAEKVNPETGASELVGAAVALAVCSAVSGAALMLRRK